MGLKGIDKYDEIVAYQSVLTAREVSNKLGIRVDQVWKAWCLNNFLEDIKQELNEKEFDKLIKIGRNSLEIVPLKPKDADPAQVRNDKIKKIKYIINDYDILNLSRDTLTIIVKKALLEVELKELAAILLTLEIVDKTMNAIDIFELCKKNNTDLIALQYTDKFIKWIDLNDKCNNLKVKSGDRYGKGIT